MTKKILLGLVAAAAGCAPSSSGSTVRLVSDRTLAAQQVGKLDREQRLTVVIGTKLHDEDALGRTIAEVRGGVLRALSGREFGARFAVDDAAYAELVGWAQANRLEIVRATDSHTTLTVSGTAADLEQALGLALGVYHDKQGDFFSPDREPAFEDGALRHVSSIVGLSNASSGWHSKMVRASIDPDAVPTPSSTDAVPTPSSSGYTAANLQTLYSWPSTATGAGTHVAILGVGTPQLETQGQDPQYNSPAVSDITAYLGSAPSSYTQVQVGDSGAGDPGDQGTLIENTLDAEMVLTFAPKAKVDHVLVVNNAYGLFSDGISYIVNDAVESSAQAVTVSYGTCEVFTAPQIPIENALFAQALAQGQQWFFASGDTGVDVCNDGSNITTPSVDWPASSPYVFAVGGTQVYNSSGSTYKEEAWGGTSAGGGGGGGGASAMFAKPSWQTAKTPSDGARDLPDVAALAGYPGVRVNVLGQATPVNGTSAASPMWGGIWADLVQHNAGKGFTQGPIDLYTLAPMGGFTDITTGSNGTATSGVLKGNNAGTGYDLATGLGTPNITKLLTLTGWK